MMGIVERRGKPKEGRPGKVSYLVRIPERRDVAKPDGTIRTQCAWINVGTFPTKKEAERAFRTALVQHEQGDLIRQDDETIAALLDRWLQTRKASLTANAANDYQTAITRHIVPVLGRYRVQAIKHGDIQKMVNAWREKPNVHDDDPAEHPNRRGRQKRAQSPMGATLIRRCVSILDRAFALAVKEGTIRVNPVTGIEKPSASAGRKHVPWGAADVSRFLEAAADDPFGPLWPLLVTDGLRKAEASALRWCDLDWRDNGRVVATIRRQAISDKSNRGAVVIVDRAKTAAGERGVALTGETVRALQTRRDRLRFERQAAGLPWDDQALIVATANGTPIAPSNINRSLARLIAKAGVPVIRVHDLRHVAATEAIRAGAALPIVSAKLGHRKVGITIDLYGHLTADDQFAAADAIDARLAAARAKSAN